ncbi:MAG TPA: CinA family protein [Chloroflexota bacterium]|nr:CinA family protein [Chloroflexota bacterium]
MAASLSAAIASYLVARGETVAVAETTAGGLIAASLVEVVGASTWFLGSAVAYSAEAKSTWLKASPEVLGAAGVVSTVGAQTLAEAARRSLHATWGLAETGIAGPQTGRRSAKQVGLVYVAVSGPISAAKEIRTGLDGRTENQRAFATAALQLLDEALRLAPSTGSLGHSSQSDR